MESVIGDDCFRKLDLEEHVLFYFAAGWCKPCQESGPLVEELAKEYDSSKIKVFKVDMVNEENREFITKCDVQSIPTFILFKDRSFIDRIVGADMDAIKNLVGHHVFGELNKSVKNVIPQPAPPEPQAVQPPPSEPEIEDFYPNETFQGEYEGFVFKNGPKGQGYYIDKESSGTKGSDSGGLEIHMVYGGWCGHSRNALPAFEELVPMKDIKTSAETPVSFVLTEDTSDGMKRFREGEPVVRGFPTYMVVKPDGEKEVLQGHDRSKDSIIKAVQALAY